MPDPTLPDPAISDTALARLPLDSLRGALDRAGYRVEEVTDPLAAIPYLRSVGAEPLRSDRPGHRPAGIHPLPPGCTVSLQFGDRIVAGAADTACLTIQSRLWVTGEDDRVSGMTCWQIRKSFRRPIASEPLDIAVETDLIMGSGVALADVLSHGRDVYRHLRLLIADARETLCGLAVAGAPPNGSAGPGLLIEARFLRGLAIGRSGLLASGRSGLSASHLRMTAAACDWLKDGMLPDLARAVRAMVRQASPALGFRMPGDAATESHPWPQDRPLRVAGDPSIVPALAPVQ